MKIEETCGSSLVSINEMDVIKNQAKTSLEDRFLVIITPRI